MESIGGDTSLEDELMSLVVIPIIDIVMTITVIVTITVTIIIIIIVLNVALIIFHVGSDTVTTATLKRGICRHARRVQDVKIIRSNSVPG